LITVEELILMVEWRASGSWPSKRIVLSHKREKNILGGQVT